MKIFDRNTQVTGIEIVKQHGVYIIKIKTEEGCKNVASQLTNITALEDETGNELKYIIHGLIKTSHMVQKIIDSTEKETN